VLPDAEGQASRHGNPCAGRLIVSLIDFKFELGRETSGDEIKELMEEAAKSNRLLKGHHRHQQGADRVGRFHPDPHSRPST